jgi:acyl carrier protein
MQSGEKRPTRLNNKISEKRQGTQMQENILNDLSRYIATKIVKQPEREIMPLEPLITGGIIDSFSLVDLALYIEDTFGVHIDDTELNAETFDTLEQLVALIEDRI